MKLFELTKAVPNWIPGHLHEMYSGALTLISGLIFTMILCTLLAVFFSLIKIQALSALSCYIGKICTYFLFFPFYLILVFFPTLYYCRPQTLFEFNPHPFFFGGIAIWIISDIIYWIMFHKNPWGDFMSVLNSVFKESNVIKFQSLHQYVIVSIVFFVWEIASLVLIVAKQKICAELLIITGASLILVLFSAFMIYRKIGGGKGLLSIALIFLSLSFISALWAKSFFDLGAYIIILLLTCLIAGYSVNVVDFGFIGAFSTTINALTTVVLLASNIIFSGLIAEVQFAFNLMMLPFLILGAIMSCRAAFKLYLSPSSTASPAPSQTESPDEADPQSSSNIATEQPRRIYVPMFFALFWSTFWIPIYIHFKTKKK